MRHPSPLEIRKRLQQEPQEKKDGKTIQFPVQSSNTAVQKTPKETPPGFEPEGGTQEKP